MVKKSKNKRGYLLLAFGSRDLNYGKMAVCCALAIKTNLKYNNVTVVLNEESKSWLDISIPKQVLSSAFDNVIVATEKFKTEKRKHFDSPWHSFEAEFDNKNRFLSYNYSPYDETILVDADFLMMNDSLDNVWGNPEDILINHKVTDLQNNILGSINDQRVSPHGIPLYWATLVYFKKTPFTKTFFNLVDYIREEYNFFQFLYGFKKGFYRNDHSFSIAAHIMSGYNPCGIKSFPEDTLRISYQKDGIAEVINSKEIVFISNNPDKQWKNTLVNMKNFNVHIMNKRELLRVSDKFIDSCMEKL